MTPTSRWAAVRWLAACCSAISWVSPSCRVASARRGGGSAERLFRLFRAGGRGCGGTVDKFIGDCIMIVFGVPNDDPHHALHALTCGMLIQALTRRINQARENLNNRP